MGTKIDRKEAIRRYKERKVARGVFAVRCTTTGQLWVGASPDLDAKENSTWFALEHGDHRTKGLQAEWNTYGKEAFTYEVLEKFDDDVSAIRIPNLLKERKLYWIAKLEAQAM